MEDITEFLEIGEIYEISEIHTYFEIAIGEACRVIYPNVNIKYGLWHMKRALNNKKNLICREEVDTDDKCFILYKMIINLYLCPNDYDNKSL